MTNPNAGAVMGYNFTDPLPANMTVANPPSATTAGCGTPTFTAAAGATSIAFANGTVAGKRELHDFGQRHRLRRGDLYQHDQ